MSFAEALTVVSESNILRLIIPRWMYWLPIPKSVITPLLECGYTDCSCRIRKIEFAYQELAIFMQQWIDTRMTEVAAGGITGNDVLSLMIKSSFEEGKYTMSPDELVSSIVPDSV